MTAPTEQDRLKIVGRWLVLVAVVLIMTSGGLGWATQTNSDNIESVDDSVQDLQAQVGHLEEFVDDLETQTPEEAEQSEAIARAVQLVPEIRVILCQAFPQVPECQEAL